MLTFWDLFKRVDLRNMLKIKDLNLNKSSTTSVTAVRFLSRVNARVGLQVGWPVELGATHITAVWLFTCWTKGQHKIRNRDDERKRQTDFLSPHLNRQSWILEGF